MVAAPVAAGSELSCTPQYLSGVDGRETWFWGYNYSLVYAVNKGRSNCLFRPHYDDLVERITRVAIAPGDWRWSWRGPSSHGVPVGHRCAEAEVGGGHLRVADTAVTALCPDAVVVVLVGEVFPSRIVV
jgi:hypothetical protein